MRRTVSGHHRSTRAKTSSEARPEGLAETHGPNPPTPLELTEQSDELVLLMTLLDGLDSVKREVFELAELQELTVPEIAELLEIPLNTAYSRLRTARQEFEAALARHEAREERGRS